MSTDSWTPGQTGFRRPPAQGFPQPLAAEGGMGFPKDRCPSCWNPWQAGGQEPAL